MPKEIKVKVPVPEDVVPEDFKKHALHAYKEFLLALRSLIDEHVKKIEELEKMSKPAGNKEIKKIEIE
jgi:hypothetical protein